MERREHFLEKVIADVRGKVSTRRQLANFSDHKAHISMMEAMHEGPYWLEAMH